MQNRGLLRCAAMAFPRKRLVSLHPSSAQQPRIAFSTDTDFCRPGVSSGSSVLESVSAASRKWIRASPIQFGRFQRGKKPHPPIAVEDCNKNRTKWHPTESFEITTTFKARRVPNMLPTLVLLCTKFSFFANHLRPTSSHFVVFQQETKQSTKEHNQYFQQATNKVEAESENLPLSEVL